MKALTIALACACALPMACSTSQKYDSSREWQRAECNKVIDKEDRDRCLKRVDETYGRLTREAPASAAR